MRTDCLPPEVAQNFHLHELEWPSDPAEQHAMLDAPFRFGDCPMDCLQGVLNLARNASVILRAPQAPTVPDTVPVIAIGSGPSLAQHIDAIRDLQHKAIIIASISAVGGLRAQGIEPHYAVPIERTEDVMEWMPDCGPSMTFAGAPFVANTVLKQFAKHVYMPDCNALCGWSSIAGDRQIVYGSSTGTAAVSLAANMTKGPVYLVGHDLAYEGEVTHWTGAKSAPVKSEGTVTGNSGEQVTSTWLWRRFQAMLGALAKEHGKVINTNITHKRGAVIDYTLPGSLPDPATLSDYPAGAITLAPPNEQRLKLWRQRAVQMPRAVRQTMRIFDQATTIDGLDIVRAVPGANGHLLSYILGSVYVQLSYEFAPNLPGKKSVINRQQAVEWCRCATMNVLRESIGIFDEVARHGECHD